jgi:hypothetical protein
VTKKTPAKLKPEPTHYVNVDVDVYSRVPLDGFVQALGDEAFILFVGGGRRKFEAPVELASSHMAMSADDTIVGLTRLISGLPRVQRKVWDSAQDASSTSESRLASSRTASSSVWSSGH